MTEQELMDKQKEYGDSRFVVTRSGKFFCAYGCGAFALARATGYRVMRRPRKGGHSVLTTGFPESRLANVLEQIVAHGGEIVTRETDSFVFSGINCNEKDVLVSEQKSSKKHIAASIQKGDAALRERILSFDLSHSTPVEAMLFLDTLQKQIKENTV